MKNEKIRRSRKYRIIRQAYKDAAIETGLRFYRYPSPEIRKQIWLAARDKAAEKDVGHNYEQAGRIHQGDKE